MGSKKYGIDLMLFRASRWCVQRVVATMGLVVALLERPSRAAESPAALMLL